MEVFVSELMSNIARGTLIWQHSLDAQNQGPWPGKKGQLVVFHKRPFPTKAVLPITDFWREHMIPREKIVLEPHPDFRH
jgi:hypothetical protein